jgi:hypothetical protein
MLRARFSFCSSVYRSVGCYIILSADILFRTRIYRFERGYIVLSAQLSVLAPIIAPIFRHAQIKKQRRQGANPAFSVFYTNSSSKGKSSSFSPEPNKRASSFSFNRECRRSTSVWLIAYSKASVSPHKIR